jgi:hypothetical protein
VNIPFLLNPIYHLSESREEFDILRGEGWLTPSEVDKRGAVTQSPKFSKQALVKAYQYPPSKVSTYSDREIEDNIAQPAKYKVFSVNILTPNYFAPETYPDKFRKETWIVSETRHFREESIIKPERWVTGGEAYSNNKKLRDRMFYGAISTLKRMDWDAKFNMKKSGFFYMMSYSLGCKIPFVLLYDKEKSTFFINLITFLPHNFKFSYRKEPGNKSIFVEES